MENTLDTENFQLDAVNILLGAINEIPLENEEDIDFVLEAQIAKKALLEVKRAVLSEGWDFNSDKNWVFAVEAEGYIVIPTNVLDITGGRGDLIMRDWRLYSKKDHSHQFTEEQKCDVIWDMDFNGLSHPIRHYVTIRAARVFMSRTIGDKNAIAYNQADEEAARLAARRSEGRTGKYNMLGSAYGVDNLARFN